MSGRSGGEDASWALLENLYRDEHEAMTRLAFLLVRDRESAAELVHDAFIRIQPRLGSLEQPGAYLRTIVVNLARDHVRTAARARRHAASQPVAPKPEPPPALPPDLHEVWIALGHLPERRRQALVLRYYADLPTAEVARLLDTRPSTARSLIRRGLASLETELTR